MLYFLQVKGFNQTGGDSAPQGPFDNVDISSTVKMGKEVGVQLNWWVEARDTAKYSKPQEAPPQPQTQHSIIQPQMPQG